MVYAAYNKMYLKGKSLGRAYRSVTGKTKIGATNMANRANKRWNSLKGNGGMKAKLFTVKKVKK